MQRTVLITGCSSGIGAAMAMEMQSRDLQVYATARRPDSLAPLEKRGIRTLQLDVNDEDSIGAALAVVDSEVGRLDMLVNNAGYSQVGAILDLEREDLRGQYETNVIAPVRVTRAAMDLLRAGVAANGRATLVNVGSIVGLFTTPFAAAYCSSKAAIHSLSDGLRMELAPFGIDVVMVQPGGVKSSFGDHAEEGMRLPEDSLYHGVEEGIRARAQAGQRGATPVEAFIRPVVDKLLRDRPPPIIRGGRNSRLLPVVKGILPMRSFDNTVARVFGLNKFKP